MKNHYRNLRDKVIRAIENSDFAQNVKICEEHAGLHFLLEAKTSLSDAQIKLLALSQGIKLSCLSDFLHKPSDKYARSIIVNYSCFDTEKLPVVIERISTAFCKTGE